MAGVAKGIIDIQINTGSAAAELKALQNQINAFNTVLSKGNLGQGKYFSDYTKDLSKAINSSGVLTSEFVRMNSAASMLDGTLKKGKSSLGQFFSSAFNKNSAGFAATMELASRRAATLQTQFINTGSSSKGMGEALAIRPLEAFSSKAAIAAERQSLLNNMFRQGTTQMINFGKNVQWSGRQLMVGFTVPLTVLGTVAGKTFMDIEKQLVNLKKVYGDAFTTPQEVNQNIAQVRQLAEEYTKYGIAVKDTIGLAANAAASGARNGDLIDATRQATRLATLGQMDQQEALKTTIALQSAFRLSGEDLADTINFLNMVENQTVVSLQDLSAAIPRVAPVIKGLGGDVRDMSVFLAAMQEGGVSAEQGANALKSGLASLINPTKAATETLSGFGINLDKIISTNRGDLMGTVFAFGEALKGLDDFSKQQALEKVFGKYQYARLGALFENIVRDGSQASQVLNLMEYDVEALRTTAEKELSAVENALGTQLIGAVERLKLSLEPIGKIFIEIAIPIVNFLTRIVEKFDGLSDGQKKFAAIAAVIVGVVVPAGTMFLGLLINLLGTLGKITHGFGIFGKALIKGGPVAAVKALTQSTKYLSIEELEASAAAKQLAGSTEIANAAMLEQASSTGILKTAVAGLVAEYRALISVQQQAAASKPGYGVAGAAGAAAAGGVKTSTIRMRGLRRNAGGEIFMSGGTTVPGMGNTDTVPAMLTPGEFVVNKEATAKNYGLLDAINSGNKFNNGGMIPGMQYFAGGVPRRPGAFGSPGVLSAEENAANIRNASVRERYLKLFGSEAQAKGISLEDRFEDLMMLSKQQRILNQRALRPQTARQGEHRLLPGVGAITGGTGTKKLQTLQKGHISTDEKGILMWLTNRQNQSSRFNSSSKETMTGKQHAEELEMIIRQTGIHPSSLIWKSGKELGYDMTKQQIKILDDMYKEIVSTFKSPKYAGAFFGGLKNAPGNENFEEVTQSIAKTHLKKITTTRKGEEVNLYDDLMLITSKRDNARNQTTGVDIPANFPAGVKPYAGTKNKINNKQKFIDEQNLAFKKYLTDYTPLNKGGIAGGMQYFGGMMPNRVVAKSQIQKISGERIEASTGHSSQFGKLAGVYDVNGRKMFVKPFATLEEAQAELIGNAARRRIAGTATPGSRIVRMDGPDGEIFATTAPMIPGMKAGTTLSTKELLKQIPASSMLGDLDATAGNILSTGGGRLVTIDPGAAGIKFKRNEKGVFRRATGNEISFGSDATNTGAYTAKAITQLIEKTGASKDYVKMLGDSIAREGLTKTQFSKMYDDAVEASIARVPSFKLPSRIGDRSALDKAAKSAGYKNADEAYSAIMLRDLTSIRGLGGDIYSSASRFQGILKANSGTLVPGMGNTDTVPAMLTPGEFVVNKQATTSNLPLLQAINSGNMQGFNSGGAIQYLNDGRRVLPTFPGMPSRRARIMMGMSDPYQTRSRSNTGQGVFKDTSATLSSTAKKMTETFKTISAKNMVYASAGEKYFQAREAVEKKLWFQQNVNKDRMKGVNTQLQNLGTAMTAAKDVVSKSSKDMAKSIVNAGSMVSNRVKNIPGDMAYKRSQNKLYQNSPEGKQRAADRKEARSQRMQKAGQGMMMASMIPMMASGFVEDPKQQQMLMGVGGAMAILPMLQQFGPVMGSLTLAAGALAGAFFMAKKDMDNTAKAAANFGSNLGGAANRMETVSAATGYGFASTRSATQEFRFSEKQAQGASEIMPYFDTDEGKKLIEDMKKLSSEERYAKVASMLTFAIADGMAPEKAEAFGSAIAFSLDDALLKSKVIALIRSGTLQAGSTAMINEIGKRQKAADSVSVEEMQKRMAEEAKRNNSEGVSKNITYGGLGALAFAGSVAGIGAAVGTTIPVFGTAIGAVVGLVAGLAYYNFVLKKQQKQVAASSKSFGSSIQTLKELKNAESLLNEERTKGTITDDQFASSQQQINNMREIEYDRIKSAIDIGASQDAQAQGIKNQLVLSGFNADTAQAVAENTTTDSVAKKMFEDEYRNLNEASKEVVDTVIASTLDGLTPENAATRIGDISDFYKNMGADLVSQAEDGLLTAVELKAEFEKFQISKFAESTVRNMAGYETMSQQQKTDKATIMTDSIAGALPEVGALGIDTSNLVNSLYELSDPALVADITKNSDSVVEFAKVLKDLPQGWDLNIATKYFSGQTEYTDPKAFFESQKEVINKIKELLPKGLDEQAVYDILEVTNVEDAEAKLKGINSEVNTLFNKLNNIDPAKRSIVFKSEGYDITKEELDAFNALPDSEQKTYLTSFIMATMQVGPGPLPLEVLDGRDSRKVGATNAATAAARKKQIDALMKENQGIQDSLQDFPSSGGTSSKDIEAERIKKLNDLLRERFELQQMVFDKDQEGYDNNIDQLNRQIESEERQVKLRKRGLEELSKKEDAVNDAYNLRVEALDKVSESNSRIGEQERSRISLASALASGDIASAASITSEMQQQSAQYQIEDAKAALEKQRQVDLDALTVSINGKLMTRKGIELEIEAIEDRIYNKGIEIQGVQDELRKLEDQRLVIAKEREKVETRTFLMAQRQAILDLTAKNGKIPKESLEAYNSLVASFKAIREIFNKDNPGALIPQLNYGGSVARMANGGIAYKGSSQPPPALRMGTAGSVPGIGMTDKVNALLTPGEFVVRKSVADENRGFLEGLNGQVFPGMGRRKSIPTNNFLDGIGSPRYSIPSSGVSNVPIASTNVVSTSSPMYNSTYNVNVNVAGTNASPDDIANVVMAKISNQNRGNLRSNRY